MYFMRVRLQVTSFESGKSQYGVYNIAGNVIEWCADWYDEKYYRHSPKRNPKGPQSGINRVARGGSYDRTRGDVRCAYRYAFVPDENNDSLGFRCVKE